MNLTTLQTSLIARVCWCCAMWGLVTEATRQDQGMEPGWLCERCADSSPSACNIRHQKEASKNAAG